MYVPDMAHGSREAADRRYSGADPEGDSNELATWLV